MNPNTQDRLEIESLEVYVVYHSEQGDVVHIHRAFTHRGAQRLPTGEAGKTRALEMAARFGHRIEGLRVTTALPDELDAEGPLRVDVQTGRLVADRRVDRT